MQTCCRATTPSRHTPLIHKCSCGSSAAAEVRVVVVAIARAEAVAIAKHKQVSYSCCSSRRRQAIPVAVQSAYSEFLYACAHTKYARSVSAVLHCILQVYRRRSGSEVERLVPDIHRTHLVLTTLTNIFAPIRLKAVMETSELNSTCTHPHRSTKTRLKRRWSS